ncbi:MAG: tRNA pseudouridine(38-40) synthase TruA [Bacteroidota bacterium]
MRYVLDLSYDGTIYAGWQIQHNAVAVQEVLENALSTLLQQPISILGAGRTDAGVHAHQMIAHFDFQDFLPEHSYNKLNGLLPKDIAIRGIYRAVEADFHARFSATKRSYQYRIIQQKDPFEEAYALWVRQALDLVLMEKATESLLITEDFASFCKAHGNNKTTICEIFHAHWEIQPSVWIFHVGANRFLRGMVRALVGTLLEVGLGKISLEEFGRIIESRDRSQAGPNVAAKGLSLTEVLYPEGSWVAISKITDARRERTEKSGQKDT